MLCGVRDGQWIICSYAAGWSVMRTARPVQDWTRLVTAEDLCAAGSKSLTGGLFGLVCFQRFCRRGTASP